MDSHKSTIEGIFICIIICCFIIAGAVLPRAYKTSGNANPGLISYSLGDVYDAKTVQMAEAYKSGNQVGAQIAYLNKD